MAASNGTAPVIQVSFDGSCMSSSQSVCVGGSSSMVTINSESCSEQSDSELSEEKCISNYSTLSLSHTHTHTHTLTCLI